MMTNTSKLANILPVLVASCIALSGKTHAQPGQAEIKYEGRLEHRLMLPPQRVPGASARPERGVAYIVFRIKADGQTLPGSSTGTTQPGGEFHGELPVFGPDFVGEECAFALKEFPNLRLKTVPVRHGTCDFGVVPLPRP